MTTKNENTRRYPYENGLTVAQAKADENPFEAYGPIIGSVMMWRRTVKMTDGTRWTQGRDVFSEMPSNPWCEERETADGTRWFVNKRNGFAYRLDK